MHINIFLLILNFSFFLNNFVSCSNTSDKMLDLVHGMSEINYGKFSYDSTSKEKSTDYSSMFSGQGLLLTSVTPINLPSQMQTNLSNDIIIEVVAKTFPLCIKDSVVAELKWTVKTPQNNINTYFNITIYEKSNMIKSIVVKCFKDKTNYKIQIDLEMYSTYSIYVTIFNNGMVMDRRQFSLVTYCCVINPPLIRLAISHLEVDIKWTQDECINSYQLELKNNISLVNNMTEYNIINNDKINYLIDVTNQTHYKFYPLKTFYSYSVILYYTLKYSKENHFSTMYKKEDFTVYDKIIENVTVDHKINCNKTLFDEEIKWTVSKNANRLKNLNFYVKVYDDHTLISNQKVYYKQDQFEYNTNVSVEYELRFYVASVEVWIENEIKETKNKTFESHCCVKDPPTISISSVTYDAFTVHWYSDLCITNYCLYLINNGPTYETPPYCEPYDRSNRTINLNTTSYQFSGLKPAYKYQIYVKYTAKYGPPGSSDTVYTQTNPQPPDKITDIILQSYDYSDSIYKFTESVQWKMPCYQNGIISLFTIYYNGVSKLDQNTTINKNQTVAAKLQQFEYTFLINDIVPYFDYTLYIEIQINSNFRTKSDEFKFNSTEWKPSEPIIVSNSSTSTSLFVAWEIPKYPNGNIISYEVVVLPMSIHFYKSEVLTTKMNTTHLNITIKDLQPYTPYIFNVSAYTKRGRGNENVLKYFYTDSDVPENVQHIQHKIDENNCFINDSCIAKVAFESPRNMNGPFESIILSYVGKRSKYEDHNGTFLWEPPLLNVYEFDLEIKPEYYYSFNITTVNNKFTNFTTYELFAPPGYPESINISNINRSLKPTDNLMVEFKLTKDDLNFTNGDIKYIAIYVSSQMINGKKGKWDNVWPEFALKKGKFCRLGHTNITYRITKKMWNPFLNNVNETKVTIGDDSGCKECNDYCNDELSEDTQYYLIIRLFTSSTYADSEIIPFKSGTINRIGLILGCIFGGLCLAIVALGGVYIWRKKYHKQWFKRRSIEKVNSHDDDPHYISVKKFANFYKNIKENREAFTDFADLRFESEKINFSQMFALLPENKRKNRYNNILPFDYTRVKLTIDEDDEIGSDYINASYIKGVSGEIEYIATQGPLLDTVKDFWKMIIQENVGVIGMVSNFIENDQKRCYRYIPNNHETLNVAKNFVIKCCSELHFGSYCIRSLAVKYLNKTHSVIHMQYLEWPDFGVPNDSESILNFCSTLRERHNMQGGLIVIHCSAGVGRTGTLIAIDILMQRIKIANSINIFNTVLELRHQRKNMVQTEEQYIFIHRCIKDLLENPLNQSSTYKLK